MRQSPSDFVTVDLRGIKPALVARALSERVSVSLIVRRAVSRELCIAASGNGAHPAALDVAEGVGRMHVKLSIRLTPAEAKQLAAGAGAAGLSRGAYLAGLIAGIPLLTDGLDRRAHLAALGASNHELACLSRNLHVLTQLLNQGQVAQAMSYRAQLLRVAERVDAHLHLSSKTLADLQPRRPPPASRSSSIAHRDGMASRPRRRREAGHG